MTPIALTGYLREVKFSDITSFNTNALKRIFHKGLVKVIGLTDTGLFKEFATL